VTPIVHIPRHGDVKDWCKIMQMQMISPNRTHDDAPEAIWKPDVTVATIVENDGRFLIVEERVRGELVLNQPAGHLEPDESLADAARRETLEETGWTVELEHLVGIYQWSTGNGPDDHFVRFAFAARAVAHDARQPLDTGIVRALWLTREEIAGGRTRPRSPMVLRCIDDWLAGTRLPLSTIRTIERRSARS
jgi:8-oxo-dGTP pyrophosphatase MutT (NUDIX family)